jgi:hypothetical protein
MNTLATDLKQSSVIDVSRGLFDRIDFEPETSYIGYDERDILVASDVQ